LKFGHFFHIEILKLIHPAVHLNLFGN